MQGLQRMIQQKQVSQLSDCQHHLCDFAKAAHGWPEAGCLAVQAELRAQLSGSNAAEAQRQQQKARDKARLDAGFSEARTCLHGFTTVDNGRLDVPVALLAAGEMPAYCTLLPGQCACVLSLLGMPYDTLGGAKHPVHT